jgi:hypothetical protein
MRWNSHVQIRRLGNNLHIGERAGFGFGKGWHEQTMTAFSHQVVLKLI